MTPRLRLERTVAGERTVSATVVGTFWEGLSELSAQNLRAP